MLRLCLRGLRNSHTSELHPYLKENLQRRQLFPLKKFQSDALEEVQQGNNIFINSCTGSGKTLSYLVPILNTLFTKKEKALRTDDSPWGAIILTLNKELCLQVYREIRLLDRENRLSVLRTGSIAHYSPVIAEMNKDFKSQDIDEMNEVINTNIAKTIQWRKTDILVSTPQLLMNLLSFYKRNIKDEIRPEFVAIDEADLLLEIDQNVSHYTHGLLKTIKKAAEDPKKIKYLITASSFPKRFQNGEAENTLPKYFKPLVTVDGVDRHKLPTKVELLYIQMKQIEEQLLFAEKLGYLDRILSEKQKKRFIIFCKQRKTIDKLVRHIVEEVKIDATAYYADLKTEERTTALNRFNSNESKILVCSDLASRGLDFIKPVDIVLEFDMAENITNFINRAGRTGRNDTYGEVISFVDEDSKQFFGHLMALQLEKEQLDELFSRKRSYRKMYVPKND